jgi:DNA polymerase-3 subunit delta'
MNNKMYPWLAPIFEHLQQRAIKQQLHHGLLFLADHGVGEQVLVEKLVQSLLCTSKLACGECKACKLYLAQSHPDMKRVISDKPSIGVDLIREAAEFVTTTSQLLGNKVVIIANIESMTQAASNSLLKTLEEPSKNTYILLTTTKPNALLPTITSRCEKVRLSLPNSETSLAWLKSKTQLKVSEEGLKAFSGSPIDYLNSINSDSSAYLSFCEDLSQLVKGKVSELLLAEKCKTQAQISLLWTYQKAVSLYKSLLLSNDRTSVEQTNSQAVSKKTLSMQSQQNTLAAQQFVFDCQQANRKINQAGINKSLILQQIFHKYKCLATALD